MMSVGCQLDRPPVLRPSVGPHPHGLRLSAPPARHERRLSAGLPISAPSRTCYQRLAPCAPAAARVPHCHHFLLLLALDRHIPRHPAISRN